MNRAGHELITERKPRYVVASYYYLKLFGKAPQPALGEKYTSVPIDIKQGEKWEGETETSMFRWRVIEP